MKKKNESKTNSSKDAEKKESSTTMPSAFGELLNTLAVMGSTSLMLLVILLFLISVLGFVTILLPSGWPLS